MEYIECKIIGYKYTEDSRGYGHSYGDKPAWIGRLGSLLWTSHGVTVH